MGSTPVAQDRRHFPGPFARLPLALLGSAALALAAGVPAWGACPPGLGSRITSGDPAAGPQVVLTGLGAAPQASFFLLGAGDANNSGTLPTSAWLQNVGDVDGDGLPDWRVEAPADGPGGWGDPRTVGCPALASPAHPPLVLVIFHDREDLDPIVGNGKFAVFEDFNHNGFLDPGEDLDGDTRVTPPGGCEGVLREDTDCDGRLDNINEDVNHNGRLDPGEDRDGDGRLDDGTEDRNGNYQLDDRPEPAIGNASIPDEQGRFGLFYPYGERRPSTGGILVISLAWSGAAYNLQALDTPTRLVGAYRLVAATQFAALLPRGDGTRIDPQGTLRMNIEAVGIALNDDAGGRAIFDAALLDFRETGEGELRMCGDVPCEVPLPRFATNGLQTLRVPSLSNLAVEAFASIVPRTISPEDVGPLRVRAQSTGSDSFLAAHWPAIPLPNLLDDDFDHDVYVSPIFPPYAPAYSPMDRCPHRFSGVNFDANDDGIGNECDPAWLPNPTVPNRWTSVDAGSPPGPRAGAASVFDAGRGVVVLFGGASDSTTWEFDGSWRQRVTGVAPEPRRGHGMISDAARGRVVLFGGQRLSDGKPLGDQWEYDGAAGSWTRIVQPVSPGPRSGFGMAYDAARQEIVLYGGQRGATLLADTWVYQAGAWRLVATPRGPGQRADAAMTWDGFHRFSVLVGGVGAGGKVRNDAWEFDGATWEPVDARGELPPTATAVASFDATRRQVLIFGGNMQVRGGLVSPLGQYFETTAATRSFDGRQFTPLPSLDTISARSKPASTFDPALDRLFVHGGVDDANVTLSDTVVLEQAADTDGDGVADAIDNCPHDPNVDQADADGDGSGDDCDDCPLLSNPDQRDRDGDGLGDACDPDRDDDGIPNAVDACPDAFVPGRPDAAILGGGGPDTDGDGVADDCDACPHDPADDADHDGICGDVDNCPVAFNPMQQDANGDGAGDACQPALRIGSITPVPRPSGALNAQVGLSDPDGDRLDGTISVAAATVIPEFYTHGLDPCAHALLPAGVSGEGLVYFDAPGAGHYLADVDSNFGCADGSPDFTTAAGTCTATTPDQGETALFVDRPTPFPICVRRLDGSGTQFDLVVYRVGPDSMVLSALLPPLVTVDYAKSHLPRFIGLDRLATPGPYILRITASDGVTPEVSDHVLFDWNGQQTMYINLPRPQKLSPAKPPRGVVVTPGGIAVTPR